MEKNVEAQAVRHSFTRRQVLGAAGAGAMALALPGELFAAEKAGKAKKIPLAVQLYSVRADIGKDLDPVLASLSKMGFTGVEFFGNGYINYDGKAKELRKKLDDLKLKSEGIHLSTAALRGDELKKTIETSHILGTRFLIVPGDGDFTNPEKSKALAEVFNKAAETLKPHGMACGYHNHVAEFNKDGDKTFWDLFAERTSKDVVMQLDVGHAQAAGVDPVALIKKHPGRTGTSHYAPFAPKDDKSKKPFIGQDAVDWKACITACREVGATEWFVIEQEYYPDNKSPLACTEVSLAGLKKILAEMKHA